MEATLISRNATKGSFVSQYKNIFFFSDGFGTNCREQNTYAINRVRFTLARFGHQISGAVVRVKKRKSANRTIYDCCIKVAIAGCGIVSVNRKAGSPVHALNQSVAAMETRVAYHVDWKSYFNRPTFSLWLFNLRTRLTSLFRRRTTSRQAA